MPPETAPNPLGRTAPDTPTIPEVIDATTARDYLEVMTRAVFQAGVSWAQIARHWNAYVRAFSEFDPTTVASFDAISIERILAEPGILRMPRKIKATIANAAALIEIEREYGSVGAYLNSFQDYPSLAKQFKKRFAFMGDMNVWYVLFRTHHVVPAFEAWVKTIPGNHPRMREMVELARAMGRSAEATPPAAASDE